MNNALIFQQLIGTINISLPLIILYNFIPHFIFSLSGISACAIGVGAFVTYVTYARTKAQADSLKFIPTGDYMQAFNTMIVRSGANPENVRVRYAYADDGVAMTLLNTIVIDPMMWKGIASDPEFFKTRDILEKFVLPGIDENKKSLHKGINEILTPDAQTFIFYHELGHVVHSYSKKRVLLTGIIAALAVGAALYIGWESIEALTGFGAIVLGIGAGMSVDLLLSYASNVFFKAREEKKADLFATKFSSRQEIEKAADFFEKYEQYAQEYRKNSGGVMVIVPAIILSGYINGVARAAYLREIARAQ